MSATDLLLTINSLLLGLISILFVIIGFFLKDLHKQFKTLVDRVNNLYTQLSREATQGKHHREVHGKEIAEIKDRIRRLEDWRLDQTD
ncbi:MAG: hypothetical protein AAF998_02785 [Bacteroidota bacterium]